jgi:hypothetical protein
MRRRCWGRGKASGKARQTDTRGQHSHAKGGKKNAMSGRVVNRHARHLPWRHPRVWGCVLEGGGTTYMRFQPEAAGHHKTAK